jgi:MFS transporter, AAHS family, 4-hydroxybenzoate transporter
MTCAKPPIDLRDVLDNAPLARMQIFIALLCGLTYGIDGFDTAVIGALAPSIAHEYGLGRAQIGELFSAAVTGMVIGYLCIAPFASRTGQKAMMTICTAGFGVLSLLTTLAHDFTGFVILRLATGLFLGAALPGTVVLTAEYSPRRWRATFITYMGLGMSVGLTSASLATAALINWGGWRAVMMVSGALPLLLSAAQLRWLPESVLHLAGRSGNEARIVRILGRVLPSSLISVLAIDVTGDRKERPDASQHAPATRFVVRDDVSSGSIAGLFTGQRFAGTLAIWTAFFMNLMVNFFMQSWLPTIFIDLGFSQRSALSMSALTMSAGFLSGFTAGPLMDRFGPFRVVCAMYACGALFIYLTGAFAHGATALVLGVAFLASYFNSSAQKGTGALCVFFYPPALRATGFGWGSGIGRIGAVVGPVIVGQLMVMHWSTQALFHAAALPMAIGALALVVLQKRYDLSGPEQPATRENPELRDTALAAEARDNPSFLNSWS